MEKLPPRFQCWLRKVNLNFNIEVRNVPIQQLVPPPPLIVPSNVSVRLLWSGGAYEQHTIAQLESHCLYGEVKMRL